MKKLVLVIAVAFGLSGCAQLSNITQGIGLVTKTITNPVTRQDEAKIELAFDAAVKVLVAYRRACLAAVADKNCKDNINQIRVYTLQAPPLIVQLRNFVDNNDQINARVVYNQLTLLYSNLKTAATNLGVGLGG